MTPSRVIGGAFILGLVVLTVWLFIESVNARTTAQIVGYQHTADFRRIVVIVALGRLDDIAEREVQENDTSVQITVRKHTSSGTAPSDLTFFPVTVTLQREVGTRAVLDDKGRLIRDLGTYELPREPARTPAGP